MKACDREKIEQYLRGELSSRESKALRDHIRGCRDCHDAYDHLVMAERTLLAGGGDDALSHPSEAEFDRIKRTLIAPSRPASAWKIWVPACVSALAAGIAVVLLLWPGIGGEPASGIRARGGGEEMLPPAFAVFCFNREGELLNPPAPESYVSSCHIGGLLKFAARTNRSYPHLLIVSSDNQGKINVLVSESDESVLMEPSDWLKPIGSRIDLTSFETTGSYTLIAIFSTNRLDAQSVRRAVAGKPGKSVLRGAYVQKKKMLLVRSSP